MKSTTATVTTAKAIEKNRLNKDDHCRRRGRGLGLGAMAGTVAENLPPESEVVIYPLLFMSGDCLVNRGRKSAGEISPYNQQGKSQGQKAARKE
jgi:hypothetical protein